MTEQLLNVSVIQWLLLIGTTLLIIEVAVLGFATFVLLFIGLAMLAVAGLMGFEFIPSDFKTAIIAVSIMTLITAAISWKFLKKIQTGSENLKVEVGFIGHRFQIDDDISPEKPGQYFYSGINWKVITDEYVEKHTELKVVHADVGHFKVTATDD
ncbi:hypothetical protein N9J94_05195 [Planktomarina sp.]|jgi:membrane protein implicated in regulation of membrane protease activity|nr:NfeD family protein [Planktomarina sp.]MDA9100640.1 hypothetical protein [Planktomarina sp.]|tara:strand:+ start:1984 stop:2448 length:465 start_codon:yes stop_codon:yes gene_type:complete